MTARKVVAGLFVSLDGVVEAPETWHFPYLSEEMGVAVGQTYAEADTLLMPLELARSVAFTTGVLDLTYRPA
ncbi:hypothetical protein ABZ860_37675 [Microbispora sp. NPDC046973]|uniref:hypothetical protein n=1 Tax=Microbispora sp. NPDC046973 TaxID=3155022 RepID=UPI003403D0B8